MKPPVEKHMRYFELLDALQKAKGCAICEMEDRSARQYLASLLYERVNDPDTRAELVRSRGFCARHAEALLDLGDGFGTAVLYQDQAGLAVEFLRSLAPFRGKTVAQKALTLWNGHTPCPVCELEEQDNRSRLHTLFTRLSEPELREAFECSAGLCMPHLLQGLTLGQDPALLQYLVDLHIQKWSELFQALSEYCRKHDHRFSKEPFGDEKDAWRRCVHMLVRHT